MGDYFKCTSFKICKHYSHGISRQFSNLVKGAKIDCHVVVDREIISPSSKGTQPLSLQDESDPLEDSSLPPSILRPDSPLTTIFNDSDFAVANSPRRRSPRNLPIRHSPARKSCSSKFKKIHAKFNKIHESYAKENVIRKKACELNKKSLNERTDTALCHILSIIGYRPDVNLEGNRQAYEDTIDFLCTLKARLIKKTKITCSDSSACDGNVDTTKEVISLVGDMKSLKSIEKVLLARLPRDEYNKIVKALNRQTSKEKNSVIKYESYHTLSKDLPPLHELETTYDETTKSTMESRAANQQERVETFVARGGTASV